MKPGIPPKGYRPAEITRLPVTVVCGFVGAGKSALVQKVVAGWASGRLAVLVHDRSDAGLDANLCRSLGIEVFRLGEVDRKSVV